MYGFSKSLMVNETKRTPKTDFLVNTFALESEKESKYVERTLFCAPRGVLTCHLILRDQKTHICIFFGLF